MHKNLIKITDNQQLFMKNLNDFIGLKQGLITIIGFDKEEYSKANLKDVLATCQCSKCGSIFKHSLNSIRRPECLFLNYCPQCKNQYRIENIEKRLKGKQKGVLKFISFDHFEGIRAFVKCQCTRCGKEVIVRDDRFSKSYDPLSCTYCYPEYNSKKVKSRYEKIHGLSGIEYEQDKRIRYRLLSLKKGAYSRGFNFDLSDEEAKKLLSRECYYCGNNDYIGLDRIDSTKGYTLGNTVSCCKYCNLMKNNLQYDLFLTQINKIFKHRINNSTTIENTEKSGSE